MNIKIFLLSMLSIIFIGCQKNSHVISKIPEASGISYCNNTNTLVVANDEGSLYEITPKGKIINKTKISKNYDLEGVICKNKKFIFADENGGIVFVDRKNHKIKYKKLELHFHKKNAGIEAITEIGNKIYLALQTKKKKRAKILIYQNGKIIKAIQTGIIDMSGMEYHNGLLYILSDTKDKLYIFDISKEKILKKIKVPKFAQEGITIHKNKIFFADDNGRVLKYKLKEIIF